MLLNTIIVNTEKNNCSLTKKKNFNSGSRPTAASHGRKHYRIMNNTNTKPASPKGKTKQKCLSPITITKPIKHTASETTPSDCTDNEFDWHNVKSNKRIRSPNNTTSSPPHTQKRNEPTKLISTNRFFAIAPIEEMNTDTELNVEHKESPPPPLIYITCPLKYVDL